MSSAARARSELPVPVQMPDGDHRVVLHGVDWRTYCAVRELLDSPGVRMTYLKGALEIMSPSRIHEDVKTRIARLVELFALESDTPLYGYGSTTFRREAGERGLEPDECYSVGTTMGEYPDIALEVIVTHGGIDKLAVYAGLGVREVWMWDEGRFGIHVWTGSRYEARERSELVPTLDFVVLAELAGNPDQHAALKQYRERLRSS